MTSHLVPALHDLAVSVAAPAIVLSGEDGQVRRGGACGWFVDDVRLITELVLSVEGSGLELVRSAVLGADRQEFTYVARRLGGWLHDPTVTIDRRRRLTASSLVEEIVVSSRAQEPVPLAMHVDVAADLVPMSVVRQGEESAPVPGVAEGGALVWRRDDEHCRVTPDPAPVERTDDRITESVQLAADRGLPLLEVGKAEFDRMSGGALHQGVGLQVPPYQYAHPDDLLAVAHDSGRPPLIVAMDGVTDPRNLGAVVR